MFSKITDLDKIKLKRGKVKSFKTYPITANSLMSQGYENMKILPFYSYLYSIFTSVIAMLFTNAKDIIIQLKKITELFFIANAI